MKYDSNGKILTLETVLSSLLLKGGGRIRPFSSISNFSGLFPLKP
jgi:hypothetical protein